MNIKSASRAQDECVEMSFTKDVATLHRQAELVTICKNTAQSRKASNGTEEQPVAGNTKQQHPTPHNRLRHRSQDNHLSPGPSHLPNARHMEKGPHVTTHTEGLLSNTISAAHPRVSQATLIRPQTSPRAHIGTPIRELLRPPFSHFARSHWGETEE
ncbi:hypothetical protein BN1723_011468 [Verticillium longisporum]|uniref:Uncharacterized protein n=1 Tax=Verticillium longisporum TaxID=100787 RepID=A0A0G4L7L0_VERLO|nr:hypothetical protein BN1723_011468 [Verticillium longisporum]CRK38319.1 hypothetical protein BN1708_007709 [Verticillium longisporum]